MAFDQARELARRIAARASELVGEPLWLRDEPAAVAGDIDRVLLGVEHERLHRLIGVVDDLGPMRTVTLELDGGGAGLGHPVLTSVAGGEDDDGVERAAAAITARVAAGRAGDWPLGVIDALVTLRDALVQRLGVPASRWLITIWGEHTRPSSTGSAGMSIDLAGEHAWPHLVQAHAIAGGISMTAPPPAMNGEARAWCVATPGALVAALPEMIDAVRAAVDGRATWRARSLPARRAAELVTEALDADGIAPGALRADGGGDHAYPRGYPRAMVWRRDDLGDHVAMVVTEDAAGIEVSNGRTTVRCSHVAALNAALPAITAAVVAELARLSPDKLRPGATYELLLATGPHGAGTRLRFVERMYIARDDETIYRFETEAGVAFNLDDRAPGDLPVLHHLERHLRALAVS